MRPLLLVKGAGIWLIILVCAVLNGAMREFVLLPAFGRPAAFVVSGIVLSVAIVVVALVLVPKLGSLTPARALYLGVFWLGLTVTFEFGFGKIVQSRTWEELVEPYKFRGGNIWPIVLLVVTLAPLIAVRIRGHR